MIKNLTCIECPMGCSIQVEVINDIVGEIKGNSCPRGKKYASTEVISPERILTSTVRTESDRMIPVKTDRPIKKADIFKVMEIINSIHCSSNVQIGDVLVDGVCGDAKIIVTGLVY